MMGMLQATVSHDLITPINNIDFFTNQMMHAAYAHNTKEVDKQHQNIKNSIKLVSNRIKDLLDRRLIENKSFQPRDIEFSPKCIIDDMVSFYEGQLA
jgi:K+-sensing histidine kinase KdpD